MGAYATPRTTGLGIIPIIAAAPAAGPAAPIVAAIAAAVSLFSMFLKFGYNPRKLADTAITEAVKETLNALWYQLTGEALNGVNRRAEPGRYGAEHIALFTPSAYPNVPYPVGNPGADPQQIIAEAQNVIAVGRSNLVRRESYAGYDANASYMLDLMGQVAAARAQQSPLGPLTTLLPGVPSNLMSLLPWLVGGYAVYKWVL